MADMGKEIHKYIQEIANATVADKKRIAKLAANTSKSSKAKGTHIDSITVQIKLPTNTVALLSKTIVNKEDNGGSSNAGGGNGLAADKTSGSLATWEATVDPIAIIQLEQSMTVSCVPTKRMGTKIMQPP
jgi:hypothetical protein